MVFKQIVILLLISLFGTSCRSRAETQVSSLCSSPSQLSDGWEVGSSEQAGFNSQDLCSLITKSLASGHNIHAVLIERKGRLIFEAYHSGSDRPINFLFGLNPFGSSKEFNSQTRHDVRSISKSIVSLGLGIAKDQGKFESLSVPVFKFYPDLEGRAKENAKAITLENLLTMTSGLRWDEGALPNDETSLYWKKSQTRFLLDRPIVATPGGVFNYNSGGNAVLADILGRAVGEPWLHFIEQNLFKPLDIKNWEWVKDLRDRPLSFTGLRLLPRDMLKIGRLVLDHGRWRGQQIVSTYWIEDSIRSHISTGLRLPTNPPEDLDYGYQWWSGKVKWQGKNLSWSAALGNGGQRIFVVPELDLVIVTLAGEYQSHEINRVVNQLFQDIVAQVNAGS